MTQEKLFTTDEENKLIDLTENEIPTPEVTEDFYVEEIPTQDEAEATTPQKKDGRGRPKKPIIKKEVIAEPFKTETAREEIFIQEDEKTTPTTAQTGKLNVIDVIPADAILLIVDKTFSVIIPAVINRLTGTKLKQEQFKLNTEEKKQLKTPLESALKTIDLNINNPFVILGLTALAVYGGKAAEALNVTGAEEVKKADGRGRPRKNG